MKDGWRLNGAGRGIGRDYALMSAHAVAGKVVNDFGGSHGGTVGLNIDTTVSMSRASSARSYRDTSCWMAAYDSIQSSRSSIVVGFQTPKR